MIEHRWFRFLLAVALMFSATAIMWLIFFVLHMLSGGAASAAPPRAAEVYRADMIRISRHVWGMGAPVAVMAAQVHQESAWRPMAQSKYAAGLAQFTPATAEWISGAYRLGEPQPFNPAWALRALALYDYRIYSGMDARTDCDRWAFTLSAYNGGPGWVPRDRKLASAKGADPLVWFGSVEHFTPRADWARRENREYPRRILFKIQPDYRAWGPGVNCDHG